MCINKEYLSQVFEVKRLLDAKGEHIRSLKELRHSISTVSHGDALFQIESAISEYEKEAVELLRIRNEVANIISRVKNTTYRTLLELRYIDMLTWEKIAETMNYNERWIYKLHQKALRSLNESLEK